MKYSLDWLTTHIEGTIPTADLLVKELTEKAFEVEGVEVRGDDTIIEVKVLPDRAHDALCHKGMAYEVASLFGLSRKELLLTNPEQDSSIGFVPISIQVPELCSRYIGLTIAGVSTKESPKWLRERLESVGQRSINALVDITNFVMFDIGQPMHAFDADKIAGGISVRLARRGETMTTLDNKELKLDGTEVVIADDEAVLALAGVKGGKKAEIDATTSRIVLESANFNPTQTRKTSNKHGIKTDASKRYENGIADELQLIGIQRAFAILRDLFAQTRAASLVDVFPKKCEWKYVVGVSLQQINDHLGSSMTESDVREILDRSRFSYRYIAPREAIEDTIGAVLGKPYKNPTSMRFDAPGSFSCSSLLSYLFTFAGIAMPSLSIDKLFYGKEIIASDLQYGDFVFSNTQEGKIYTAGVEYAKGKVFSPGVDHVGMYLGGGEILHASKTTNGVVKEKLADAKQFANIVAYRRMHQDLNEPRFVVTVPAERLDLRFSHDLIEEIGRKYGYNKIKAQMPESQKSGVPHKRLYYANKVRKFLSGEGYSEVYTYSFAVPGDGDIEVENPVGKDRPFLRRSLLTGVRSALSSNLYWSPLLRTDQILIFELGNVFTQSGERMMLALGSISSNKKKQSALKEKNKEVLRRMAVFLGVEEIATREDEILQIDFDSLIVSLPEPSQYEPLGINRDDVRYETLSVYPFIVRDIALFVPAELTESEIEKAILSRAGNMVVRFSQFDKFQKPGESRISYGYRLVFQSFERTLTDEEVNKVMEAVYAEVGAHHDWQVR